MQKASFLIAAIFVAGCVSTHANVRRLDVIARDGTELYAIEGLRLALQCPGSAWSGITDEHGRAQFLLPTNQTCSLRGETEAEAFAADFELHSNTRIILVSRMAFLREGATFEPPVRGRRVHASQKGA
jgi:hypothetical protein